VTDNIYVCACKVLRFGGKTSRKDTSWKIKV